MSVELIARRWERPVESVSVRRSPYGASWPAIVTMLRGELRHIGASQVIVEMDISPNHLRNDGWIYSNARPGSPGVRLSFKCRYGELSYEAGTWANWEHNIYAVARTLRAQRMIARDGAVKGDQVYRGFKALPGTVSGGAELKAVLLRYADMPTWTTLTEVYRAAARKWHPDLAGSDDAMRAINQAKSELERLGAL